jgi:histidinol-phosphate aminotransferase
MAAEYAGPALERVHGGPREEELRRLGIDPAKLVDFSVNSNPRGPCRRMVEAVRNAALDRYPDPTAWRAREVMSASLGVAAAEIALGNGAAELIWTLARVLLRARDTALVVEPTFSEFRLAVHSLGARVVEWRAREADGFRIALEQVERVRHRAGARVVYLCAPNTPTGSGASAARIADFARAGAGSTIVLDQSFLSLSDDFADADVPMPPNVVRVRSLTKEHAIPGVRLGYLLAVPELVAALERQRPAWTTSAMAQAAAIAACEERAFVAESRRELLRDRRYLQARLGELGLTPLASRTAFFLMRVTRPAELVSRLLERHELLVRDCTSFGLPDFIRVAARPAADAERLIDALGLELLRC